MFQFKKYIIKTVTIFIMSFFYVLVGVDHFKNPDWYIKIIPPVLPFKLEMVYLSGFFEILFGILLLFKKTRQISGWGLVLLLLAVYPANLYLAITNGEVMNTTPYIAWGRLPIQFLFIGLAYWHANEDIES
tara:strand:- start:25 stop:417 length:393 start_codon:yes stop_codon:yes gene_type:complete